MTFAKSLLGLAFVAFISTIPASAYAQTCRSNADCAKGTICQGTEVPPTDGTGPACGAASGCASDTPTTTAALVARDAIQMFCVPAPCSVDGDCGAGMLCHSETVRSCSGGTTGAEPCKANTMCEQPTTITPETCTETKISACAYKWQLPCNADADCGTDFVCNPSVSGTCSGGTPGGGGGTGSSSGSAVAPDQTSPLPPKDVDGGAGNPATCTTTTSFPGYCTPRATTCSADGDCPAAWTCTDTSTPTGGAGTKEDPGAASRPASADAGAPTSTDIPVTTTTPTKACQPPASFPSRNGGGGTDLGGDSTATPAPGQSTTTGSGPGAPESAHSSGGCTIVPVAGTTGSFGHLGVGALLLLAASLGRRARRR